MALADILAKFLELIGLKKTDAKKYDETEKKLRASKAANSDRLEGLKEKIAALEAKARAKKKEYDASTGDTKRIVGTEIERVFGDLDRLRGQETIIGSNLDKLSTALAKLEEWRAAKDQGVDEDLLDDLAIELEDAFADLRVTDRSAKDLENVRYDDTREKPTNVESRMAELQGEEPASEGLSQSTADRLKALEEE